MDRGSGLQFTGLQRVGHDWATDTSTLKKCVLTLGTQIGLFGKFWMGFFKRHKVDTTFISFDSCRTWLCSLIPWQRFEFKDHSLPQVYSIKAGTLWLVSRPCLSGSLGVPLCPPLAGPVQRWDRPNELKPQLEHSVALLWLAGEHSFQNENELY